MADHKIHVYGAREHNLQDINLELPREQLIVFCGVSGSGKSSLAFDTIYAEGQRKYVESLSTHARALLGDMERPSVDHIDGLSPAIAIDQRSIATNPRSTVATATDIYDFLRVLYARVGEPHCPECGRPIAAATVRQIVDQILSLPEGTKILVLAPVEPEDTDEPPEDQWYGMVRAARRSGFARMRVDGEVHSLDRKIDFDTLPQDAEIVVDRLVVKPDIRSRLADSVETALAHGSERVIIAEVDGDDHPYSTRYACPVCDVSIPQLTPQMFSFNNPHGMCERCEGLGVVKQVDPSLLIADPKKSILAGALKPYGKITSSHIRHVLEGLAEHYDFDLKKPWNELSDQIQDVILYGTGETEIEFTYEGQSGQSYEYSKPFEGIVNSSRRRLEDAGSSARKSYYKQFVADMPCPDCNGTRLRPESLAVTVGGKNIGEITAMTVEDAGDFCASLRLEGADSIVASELITEIQSRLDFMVKVGVGYLTLDRPTPTLSRGEGQRIRLATQLGSGLAGIMYILDEPSIGLHRRDQDELLKTITRLRDIGNTVIVVEHDPDTICSADHVVEFGPGAGNSGGNVVFNGTPEEMLKDEDSLTGKYLSGRLELPVPAQRRDTNNGTLRIKGARQYNLKDIDAHIPLGVLTCVTGVSGSGKSTLVHDILYRSLRRELHRASEQPGAHNRITGVGKIEKIINVDQRPIGRTPRSNPATYTKVYGPIRDLFAETPEARMRGYDAGRFSFNTRGGRCEACEGKGIVQVEMDFLPDVYVRCDECGGDRFNRETLEVRYKGQSIADVLDLTVAEALELFENVPQINRILQTLVDVGLEYLKLGQPATTLSAGEAQRIKLARELARPAAESTLYILDEPTTGLHFADIEKLMKIVDRLLGRGHTVIIIEHNLDVVKMADHIIDLGPEGGEDGGYVVASGTPEEVAKSEQSYTGQYLREILDGEL
ncbi:MAG: excinuclease ABC subunit UvrA [Armatimonadota bacterium]